MVDRRRLPGLCAALLVPLLSACAAADPAAQAELNPRFDAQWRTFVWARPLAPAGVAPGPDPATYQRVETAVGKALAKRGYAEGQPAQFAVGLTFGAPNAVRLFTHGPTYSVAPDPRAGQRGWGGVLDKPQMREPTEGMLTIDVFDVSTRKPVWRATSRTHLGRDAGPAEVQQVVDALLADLPPAGGPS